MYDNYIVVIYIFRLNMETEFTVESFSTYLKDLGSEESDSTVRLSKAGDFNTLRLQLDTTPHSQKTLDGCLLIGLRYLSSQSQHIAFVVAALKVLLHLGAKWDSSTLFDNHRTPCHIICQCLSDPYALLDEMIKSSGGELVNEKDSSGCTAMMYAVQNKNVECLRCLIDHGADLNLGSDIECNNMTTPLIDAIRGHSSSPSPITRDILNLLLEGEADVDKESHVRRSPITYAMDSNCTYCVRKLVLHGAELNPKSMWLQAVNNKSINMLGCLLDLEVSKDFTDTYEHSVLHRAICIGDITIIRFLLEAGVPIKGYREFRGTARDFRMTLLPECMINNVLDSIRYNSNPCFQAIALNRLDVVQFLDNYEQQTFQSIEALKCAVSKNTLKMVNYLLSKYKYPLNVEYLDTRAGARGYQTILTEVCHSNQLHLEMVTLLVEHGADPAKKSVHKTYQSAFLIAINSRYNDLVAHFIRCGVNLDRRLHDDYHQDVLLFECAVIKKNKQAAEMLLHAGCLCGMFNLVNNISTGIRCFMRVFTPEFEQLLIEWDVHKNKVKPLQQLSRKSILKHLCPRAVKKIRELPLPSRIIRYLSIPELDDVQV